MVCFSELLTNIYNTMQYHIPDDINLSFCHENIRSHELEMFVFFPDSEHPLSLYVFSKDKSIQNLLVSQLRCGSLCVNDTLMQFGGESNKKSSDLRSG